MVQSLMAIAAFVAVVGGIIFGVSRYEKSNTKEDSIERLIPTPPQEPAIAEIPVAAIDETSEISITEPELTKKIEAILNPQAEESEAIDETPEPREEPAEVILPPAIQDPKQVTEEEPRAQTIAFTIPPTIQDPKRPNDGAIEDLTQDILVWGQSKDLKHVSKLMQYTTHADPMVRGNVAIALGQIARQNSGRSEVERSIPVLGKLTQDSDLKVRQYAVQALGEIRSEKVLPYLQKALQSPSGSVMKAANGAIQNLKLQYGKTPAMQIAQQMLKKAEKTSV
ncbi:HEAT repeat domain-containing protein [Leptolyngbya sp. AN03gr2]|uniref:HEAT repeat domain-containing protein n=1 Tax=unclassified Leptolyngbya TaxID=2650499 RepID=UPI003D31CBE5